MNLSLRHSNCCLLALLLVLSAATPCHALIRQLYRLQEVIDASDIIVEVEVSKVSSDPKTCVFLVKRALKGYPEMKQIKLNLAQGEIWYPDAMLKLLNPGQKGLFFYEITSSSYRCLAHINGIWFQASARKKVDMNDQWWRFVQIEQWMHRTYKGSSEDLIELTKGVIAGTRPSPEPDASLPKLTYEEIVGETMPAALAKRETARIEAWRQKILQQYRATNSEDGYEAVPGWKAEDFKDGHRLLENMIDPEWDGETEACVPRVAVLEDQGTRGDVLQVSYDKGANSRVMSTYRELRANFARGRFLAMEAKVISKKPVEISCVLWTQDLADSFTSKPIKLKPGSWKYDVVIPLYGAVFRTAETTGEYSADVSTGLRIGKLEFLIHGTDEPATVLLDRIRLERRSSYIRSLEMPHTSDARGVTCTDYDGDADLDVLICSTNGNRLYRNDGGDLVDVTDEVGLVGGSCCAGWADYDHDGDLDLLFSTPAVWENQAGKFHNVSQILPKLPAYNTEGAGWIDANGDGRPDILLSNGEYGLYLFLNTGAKDNPFVNVSAEWGLGPKGIGCGDGDYLSIADFDNDGFPDFLYNVGLGLLVRNIGGSRFSEVDGSMIEYATGKGQELGTTFIDMNRDGLLDVLVAQLAKSRMYINNNDLTFLDFTHRTSLFNKLHANVRSILATDTDLDGDEDVIFGVSDRPPYYLENNGFNAFQNKSTAAALASFPDVNQVSGVLSVDWDKDGDEDALLVGKTAACILINATQRAKKETLQVILDSTETPGALIRIYDSNDRPMYTAQPGLCQNFCSQGPMQTTLFVDPGEYVVSVLFTDGQTRKADVLVKRGFAAICRIFR